VMGLALDTVRLSLPYGLGVIGAWCRGWGSNPHAHTGTEF
jgi:hypothetical protein